MSDLDPHDYLAHVHPDLARVMGAAAQSPTPFVIVYGLRTAAAEREACASGHSTTMHSRHLPNAQGLSCAVDVAALVDGEPNWVPGHEASVFGQIASQVKAAASSLDIPVQWGGDWSSFKDWGHFQLRWSAYP